MSSERRTYSLPFFLRILQIISGVPFLISLGRRVLWGFVQTVQFLNAKSCKFAVMPLAFFVSFRYNESITKHGNRTV